MATIDPSIQKILNSLPQMPPLLQALLAAQRAADLERGHAAKAVTDALLQDNVAKGPMWAARSAPSMGAP